MQGKNVLLIDLDPQAHTTIGLGIESESHRLAINDVLIMHGISQGKGCQLMNPLCEGLGMGKDPIRCWGLSSNGTENLCKGHWKLSCDFVM